MTASRHWLESICHNPFPGLNSWIAVEPLYRKAEIERHKAKAQPEDREASELRHEKRFRNYERSKQAKGKGIAPRRMS